MKLHCVSEITPLKAVLLKHPRPAFCSQREIDQQWQELRFTRAPDLAQAIAEYDAFVALLQQAGAETVFLLEDNCGLDSIYVRDAVVITARGAIICNMAKPQRRDEPKALQQFFTEHGMQILGAITGTGRLEGGDVALLDERTIVVGEGYRTNAEGIRQLRALTQDHIDEMMVVPLPHWNGPEDLIHLMSLLSPVAEDIAVVYSRLMPVRFREYLLGRGTTLVEVPDEEFLSMGCNVLAVAPRKCIMLAGNLKTRARLEARGVEVFEFAGEHICLRGGGGPTCLTRPLYRKNS
jgi:arginine deiminase